MWEVLFVFVPIITILGWVSFVYCERSKEIDIKPYLGVFLFTFLVFASIGSLAFFIAGYKEKGLMYVFQLWMCLFAIFMFVMFVRYIKKFVVWRKLRDENVRKIAEQWYKDVMNVFSKHGYSRHNYYLDLSLRFLFIRDNLLISLLLLRIKNRERLEHAEREWNSLSIKSKISKENHESLNIIYGIKKDIEINNNKLLACLDYLDRILADCKVFFFKNQCSEPGNIDLKSKMDKILEMPDILRGPTNLE
jgi:hypothetical protein